MARDPKEGFFGGLPPGTFNGLMAFLQSMATTGNAAEQAAAYSVLVSVATSEHEAATSSAEVDLLAAATKVVPVDQEVRSLNSLSGQALLDSLGRIKQYLDELANVWKGQ
jgi:hypothetical protein